MPHFNHQRRHSWPYCGSGTNFYKRDVPVITVTGPPDEVETQFLAPVILEDLLEDDAAAAGIDRTQSTNSHHRLWHHSKTEIQKDHTIAGTVSLRKMMQPSLDRALSLFILPTAMSAGEAALLPYWVHRLSKHPIMIKEKKGPRDVERGRLMVEKKHRRCHSERPRSWKQPSEKLWTLQEE
ncbi:hypothetical protein BJX70DRAFT_73088 [Aspergillus crustosus]